MAYGFKVWDSEGRVVIDSSKLIGRIFGTAIANTLSGSITHSGLATGIPFAVPLMNYSVPANQYSNSGAITMPKISFNGSTMSWTREEPADGDTLPTCTIMFGAY